MHFSRTLPFAILNFVDASTHYLFSGAFAGSTIGVIGYDDSTQSLFLVQNAGLTVDTGSKWIAIDASQRTWTRKLDQAV